MKPLEIRSLIQSNGLTSEILASIRKIKFYLEALKRKIPFEEAASTIQPQ